MFKIKVRRLIAVSLFAFTSQGSAVLSTERLNDVEVPVRVGDKSTALQQLQSRFSIDQNAEIYYQKATQAVGLDAFKDVIREYNKTLIVKEVSQEASKEEREQRQRLEKEHQKVTGILKESTQKIQEVTQQALVAEQALAMTSGMKQEEVRELLVNLQSVLRGFSDGLFMMKFSGDEEPEFEATLTKIAKQSEVSAKTKKACEKDKEIKKLDIFLQLPSNLIDLDPVNRNFIAQQRPLAETFKQRITQFQELVKQIKSDFEMIRKKPKLLATEEDLQYFEKYWLIESEEGDVKEERKEYRKIFESAQQLINFYTDLLHLLEKQYKTPIDFKKEYDLLFKRYANILLADFSEVVGGERLKGNINNAPKVDAPQILLLNISGLSLYHYLRLAKDKGSEQLQKYIAALMKNIKMMRNEAFQLKCQLINKSQEVFMKCDEEDSDLSIEPKKMKELFGYIDQYEKAMGENSLYKNIKKFLLPNQSGFTDLDKMKDYKKLKSEAEMSIVRLMKKATEEWEKFFNSKIDFYQARQVRTLRGIFASELNSGDRTRNEKLENIRLAEVGGDRVEKSRAVVEYETYLYKEVQERFKRLYENAHIMDFKLLFDEPVGVKVARQKRNERIQADNDNPKATEKKPLEAAPPLTVDISNIGTLIRLFLINNENASFDDFWNNELRHQNSDVCKFMKLLKNKDSELKIIEICKAAFDFIKENTEEERQLCNLFDRVIEAHKHHEDFLQKMELLKAEFEIVKAGMPNYGLDQQPIRKKVQQLQDLLEGDSDAYLKLDPEIRAINFAYNFPMFYETALKPLDRTDQKMKIWGAADDTAFDAALKEAHEAYVKARDAIQAINPSVTDDNVGAIRLGGFYKRLAQASQVEPLQHILPVSPAISGPTINNGMPPMRGGPRGGPTINNGIPPMLGQGGPLGEPPPIRSDMPPMGAGQTLGSNGMPPMSGRGGLRGGPVGKLTPVKPVSEEEQVKGVCNAYYKEIEKKLAEQNPVVTKKLSKLFEEVYKTYLETPTEQSVQESCKVEVAKRREKKQKEIKESVTSTLFQEVLDGMIGSLIAAFEYQYMDKGRPEIETVLETISSTGSSFKIKERFDEIFNKYFVALKEREEKNASMWEKRKKPSGAQGAEASESKDSNPFGRPLKKANNLELKPLILEKTQKEELELAKIQPVSSSEEDKKTADEMRLNKIKKFLTEEKGAQFVSGFADPELLAFPLGTLMEIESSHLENLREGFQVDHLPTRKFSSRVLTVIKDVRFNKNEEERIKSAYLTPENIRKETPRQLLGVYLQVSPTIMQSLNGDAGVH